METAKIFVTFKNQNFVPPAQRLEPLTDPS